jgi:hypothetical protein
MRIRIWNAYASNNSGSYTIVGRFNSDDAAAKVAAELLALVKAQCSWAAANDGKPSPLVTFAEKNGLSSYAGMGARDDWPEYSQQDHPEVWTVGSQLFLYSDYQVTMPRTFGELIYARGGRVEYEVDHAHHPMAALFEISWPWGGKTTETVAEGVEKILRALHEDPRFYENQQNGSPYHAWRIGESLGMEPDLRLGAVFADLITGFAAVDAAAQTAGAHINVRLHESFSPSGDDFPFLRPSKPPLEPDRP